VGIKVHTRDGDRYAIVVFWSEADRTWVADVPDLKSCAAVGNTRDEAAVEVSIAIGAWLDAARDTGLEIPKPVFPQTGFGAGKLSHLYT
jgi:predicted RNase H-like HicB family nuclease